MTPLPRWRFPPFHTGLRRLTWWWCCSPLELQTHFSNKSGEEILDMGRREGDASSQTTRLMEMLDPSYHPFCLVSSLQHWMPRKEARKPANISWHFPETASELWPTWFCSWANTGILPQTIPDKKHSKLYHTDKWRVKQNFLWSCIHIMEAVFLHLRNPEQSKIVFQSSMKVWSRTSDKHFAIV